MGIWICGQRFDVQFEQNIDLIPQLIQKLAAEASQDSTPAGDALPQPADLGIQIRLSRAS